MQGAVVFLIPFNYKVTKESSSEFFFKSVKIWQSYGHESVATLFLAHPVDHKVTGLRLAASATAHGLAAWLHLQAGWLFQCYKYDAIRKTGNT